MFNRKELRSYLNHYTTMISYERQLCEQFIQEKTIPEHNCYYASWCDLHYEVGLADYLLEGDVKKFETMVRETVKMFLHGYEVTGGYQYESKFAMSFLTFICFANEKEILEVCRKSLEPRLYEDVDMATLTSEDSLSPKVSLIGALRNWFLGREDLLAIDLKFLQVPDLRDEYHPQFRVNPDLWCSLLKALLDRHQFELGRLLLKYTKDYEYGLAHPIIQGNPPVFFLNIVPMVCMKIANSFQRMNLRVEGPGIDYLLIRF
jgi:hypothetical protein